MLANCGTDIRKARQALTTYISRKQEKGRSTEHVLNKLRQLELKFINDTTLHSAFRDARANTCLPRSPDLPLPRFVLRDTTASSRDSHQSLPTLRDFTTPSPSPSTPYSWTQSSSSSVQPADSYIIEEDQIQPAEASHMAYEASSRPPSLSPTSPLGKMPVLSPYAYQISSGRSRSSTLPSSLPQKKFRASYNSPPPTSPLPDLPPDATDEYDSRLPQLHLPPPADHRHLSFGSQSSSSSHSSYPIPCTPEIAPPIYPGLSSRSTVIIRGDVHYPQQREEKLPQQPLVVDHYPSETDIPSMFLPSREGSFNTSKSSFCDFPSPNRDSPILRERSSIRNFSFPLDNVLKLCAASVVVRREVAKCLQQERGYEQDNWPTVLRECGIAQENFPLLLNEMAREADFMSRA